MSRGSFPLFLMLAYASAVAVGQANPYTLDRMRMGLNEGRTRIVFDMSGSVEYQVQRLKDPSRIVLNIADTVMEGAPFNPAAARKTVKSVDVTAQRNGSLRVEIYLAEKVEYNTFLLSPYLDRGYRLVVDLYPGPSIGTGEGQNAKIIGNAVGSSQIKRRSVLPDQQAGLPTRTKHSSGAETGGTSMDFSGTWEQEWAIDTDGGGSQKFEAIVEPRFEMDFAENSRLTAIARVRLDALGDLGPDSNRPENYSSINGPFYNDANAEFSLRELYLDTKWYGSYWRIGKQQVVWGQADGIKVLDVVNPQSFREFILDDFDKSRIPLTMFNMQMPVGDEATLQMLWIPDTTYHELAEFDTPYFLSSPLLVPVAPEGISINILDPDVPENLVEDSDIGGRLTGFIGGWDVTVNYLYHYQDYPVLYQSLGSNFDGMLATVSPEYERNHLFGGTVSDAFGEFTLRAEVAYSTDTFQVSSDFDRRGIADSAELASVIGLDWQLGGYDTLLSVQWFQSHLFDYESKIRRDKTEHNASFYYQRHFANQTLQFNTLVLYSINNQDSLIQTKLKYFWRSNLELWIGADIFSGDREGIYGQFNDVDRMLLGLELGF